MMTKAFLAIALVLACALSVQAKVKLVIDLIRHGARAPSSNSSFFPNITWTMSDELTPVGERQHCLLGRLRRLQYIETAGLLPAAYDPTLIYVRSTDTRRTLMSAQAYLIGLYPTGLAQLNANQTSHAHDLLKPPISLEIGDDIIDELKADAMPFSLPIIPVQSVNSVAESVLYPGHCMFIDAQLNKYYGSAQYKKLISETYHDAWQQVMSGYPDITQDYLLTHNNAYNLADFIICAARDGRRPAKLAEDAVERLRAFVGEAQRGMHLIDPMVDKIWLTDFTKEVLSRMNQTMTGGSKTRYVLYSAHDVTEVAVLVGLMKINNTINFDKVPDFASNLLFELDVADGLEARAEAYTVSVYFNGDLVHHEPYSTFQRSFEALGELKMSREDACRTATGLRLEKGQRPRVGIIEDFKDD